MLSLIPTDTCYGLTGEFTETDYHEIYRLKGRDFSKPLAFLVENFSDMKQYIEISDEQIEFLKNYPHPWSFLGKRICELPEWMDKQKYEMVSLRVANVCLSQEVREKISFPLFLTSANLSGMLESTTLESAKISFLGIDGIDGGVCNRPPSDIFSIGKDNQLQYLRKNY